MRKLGSGFKPGGSRKGAFPELHGTLCTMVPAADPGAFSISGYEQHMKRKFCIDESKPFCMPHILCLQEYIFF